jgi:molybdopterin-guanine dinucleotide biosynthesis protein A
MRTAAILAGGRATRFDGRDKSALVVGGRTILERQIAMLSEVDGVDERLIVGSAMHPSARTIADIVPGCGPLGGIHAALTEARHDALFVIACDTPYPTGSLVSYLFEVADGADIVVPQTEDGYHPLCAVYTRRCLDTIAERLAAGPFKVADLFDAVRTRVVSAGELARFGDPRQLFANVNTPADYLYCRQGVAAVHDHKL